MGLIPRFVEVTEEKLVGGPSFPDVYRFLCNLSIKTCFYGTSKFFIQAARRNFTKLLAVSEISTEIKSRLYWTRSVILLTSPFTCKQRLLHGNVIEYYLQNCKCCNVGQDPFRNPLSSSLIDPNNFQRLLNFRLLLTFNFCLISKAAKLYFLKSSLKYFKTWQNWYPYDPVSNNGPLSLWKTFLFRRRFSCKIRKFKYWF